VGSKILLEEADIEFPWGRRFGLIGKNGIGKTQLLGGLARGEFGGFEDL
jgi:ATPase subunit of ABC transporter with duplicated ATPase domains